MVISAVCYRYTCAGALDRHLTLALGMGATTAFFSALCGVGVVLRQPNYPDAARLVVLQNMLAANCRTAACCPAPSFASTANASARTLRLNGIDYQVVALMPADFAYPESGMAAWLRMDLAPRGNSDRGDHYLAVVARLAGGVSADQARDDLQRVARQLRQDAPGAYPTDAAWTIGFDPLRHRHFGRVLLPLATLTAAAAAALLIACVNVAIMSLLRTLDGRRESSGSSSLKPPCSARSERLAAF